MSNPSRGSSPDTMRRSVLLILLVFSSCSEAPIGSPGLLEQQAESANQPSQAKEAIADYDAVLAQEPRNARALAHRAASYLAIGRNDLALDDVNQAVTIDGGTAFAFTVKALAEQNMAHGKDLALVDAGRVIALLQHSSLSKHDTTDAFVVFDAIDRNYAATSAYTLRAEIRKERKQYDLALADVDAILDFDPNMTSAWVVRASIERAQGKFAAALQDDLQALGQHWHSEQAIPGLCSDHAALGQVNLAIRRCNEALVTAPLYYLGYVNRGIARLKSGAMSEAQDDFEHAMVIAPAYGTAVFGRGLARIGAGEEVQGRADIARAIQMDAEAESWFRARGVRVPAPLRT